MRNRLAEVGLISSFLLSLHSHHASRKEVARELGAALSARPEPRRQGTAQDRERLRKVRTQLSSYAAA